MRCVALFSGGLDSQLAVRLMQQQGIDVEAVHVHTPYCFCAPSIVDAARRVGVRLHCRAVGDDYLEVLERPRFGYGKGANPCIDCRIYMARTARHVMLEIGARFVVSGEVVGQRPMSQKRRDLDIVAYHAGLEDLLLRPLCAKHLPATLPERSGWVDRARLFGFSGRRRQELVQLAETLGITSAPQPSTGCALTDKLFGVKVFDLLNHTPATSFWDYEALRHGRHFRLDAQCKVIVGRDQADNEQLRQLHEADQARSSAVLVPEDFLGPTALVVGPVTASAREFAGALILRYARNKRGPHCRIRLTDRNASQVFSATSSAAAEAAVPLGTALAKTPHGSTPPKTEKPRISADRR